MFQAEMKKLNFAKLKGKVDESRARKMFLQLAEKVGQELGHIRTFKGQPKVTGLTAVGNYIDPAPMLEFFQKLGLRPPNFLEKFQA
jgi:hypothetical protein